MGFRGATRLWEARTRNDGGGEAAETDKRLEEAFMLLDTIVVVLHGKQGHSRWRGSWCRWRLSQEGCGGIGRKG